ncbi:MAG: prepilin-type N-terminal cleavage/methylation domain-containing protein [Deltaproteobacteria bacterium]|nr:MAG: prepilin-type N-terminal cleavage/methylation domain-containing protein [Deltaproteobacteria bacterium]TDJ04572.1 MAG: prepilin-type N-terminal cleavage/methylation domain-containing protein [Deltaproteobacteria bacterium]
MSKQSGFTILEVLIAILIMSTGFIALSQMQFLSILQKQRAEAGTIATNIVQFANDSDLAKAKKMHQLNILVLLDTIAQRTPDYTYCGDSTKFGCTQCPCDPLTAFTPNPVVGNEKTCSIIDINDFDPENLIYTNQTTCQTTLDSFGTEAMILVKDVDTNSVVVDGITILTLSIMYGVKSKEQFRDSGLSVLLKDTLVAQSFEVTAHLDNYNENGTISSNPTGWINVRVPHLP